jgi:tetratricopeptide (TPR) repeat protein
VMLFFNFARFRVPVVPILALFAYEGLLALGAFARRAWELAVAFAGRTADLTGRLRALVPDRAAGINGTVFVAALLFVNVEYPRGVVPAIEQALSIGNAYYADGHPDEARQSYYRGLVLLGEGPEGPAGDELLKGFGPGVTRTALLKELEIESVARGPEFKGIHVGIHHGLGIALVLQAQALLDQGKRGDAMALLDRAVDQFHEALRLAPSYLLSHRKLARAYELKGDTAQAVEWLRKAVDLWPEDMQARMELSELLYNTGDYDAALRHIETAAHYNPGMGKESLAQLYYNRALVFLNGQNDKATALYDFEKTLEVDPAYPRADAIRETIRQLRQSGVQPQDDAALERAMQPSAAPPPGLPPATAPAR